MIVQNLRPPFTAKSITLKEFIEEYNRSIPLSVNMVIDNQPRKPLYKPLQKQDFVQISNDPIQINKSTFESINKPTVVDLQDAITEGKWFIQAATKTPNLNVLGIYSHTNVIVGIAEDPANKDRIFTMTIKGYNDIDEGIEIYNIFTETQSFYVDDESENALEREFEEDWYPFFEASFNAVKKYYDEAINQRISKLDVRKRAFTSFKNLFDKL